MCQAWWPQSGTGAWGPWGVGPGYPTLSETWAQPPTCSDGNPQRWEPKHRRFFRPASHGPPGSKCATYDCVALHGYTISSGDWPACPPQGRWPHSCGMGVGHGTECTPPMERVTLKVGVAGALSTSACSHCRVNTSNAKHCTISVGRPNLVKVLSTKVPSTYRLTSRLRAPRWENAGFVGNAWGE